MPNTGQIQGQAFKCEKCRQDFSNVWLPSNPCCRIKMREIGQNTAIYTTPYSRHLSYSMSSGESCDSNRSSPKSRKNRSNQPSMPQLDPRFRYVNSLAPFSTLGKPTCGFYFSRETDNKKRRTGIPPSDLVAWRSHIS
ncbi:predicted protein [Nematostella vectensis]|uniref:Uncharacterized protein n=1 Tax=Nematostella vectensis TaxID=45351 RepID=A7SAT3_NEMVE|nr:uncharacterized protein LOC125560648 [Nematostella vectensis]EDO39202.1 predicted protein [Nematostella vectensis]|eukprot:XP_001631265.1 predicted protein [Nematostella vectensis]